MKRDKFENFLKETIPSSDTRAKFQKMCGTLLLGGTGSISHPAGTGEKPVQNTWSLSPKIVE